MAFRAVRTAAVLTVVLLLAAGCAETGDTSRGTSAYDGLPDDTVTLSPEDLARLPWYGVQQLPCDTVDRYLVDAGLDTTTTRTIELRLDGDSLIVDPAVSLEGVGDTIRLRSDSLVWVAQYKESSPFTERVRTVRGGQTMGQTSQSPSASGESLLIVRDDSGTCGRYYFSVAAYHPDRPGEVHVADPPTWIRF